MNTGAVIAAVGAVLTTILTGVGAWFAKKGDRNARMTQRYFDDAEFNSNMVGALRQDYWGLYAILGAVGAKWHTLVNGLPAVCAGSEEQMAGLMARVGEFPDIPEPTHLKIEREHLAKRAKAERGETVDEPT